MELTWLGHSCFRLRGRDLTVVTDPFGAGLGLPMGKVEADVVTVSHDEPNHNAISAVGGGPRVVAGPGEYELAGVMITGVATPRPPGQSRDEPRNTAYLLELDDVTICHLGDLAAPLTSDQVAVVKDADVLLVPVGGHCTIDGAQAAEVVAQVEPKLVVPMHYQSPGVRVPLDAVDRFCHEIGAAELTPQGRLNVTRGSLPDQLTVVLLEQRK
ncbi:MAG TPA: MBL fold metallo-hydrolase [Chloroflexota bacterium]|jgi:L-ascorbate metabolism protein UlaG (beta-lactamase superfamily)